MEKVHNFLRLFLMLGEIGNLKLPPQPRRHNLGKICGKRINYGDPPQENYGIFPLFVTIFLSLRLP